MKQVINSQSKERIGFLSSLDEILDVGKRFLFEPRDHEIVEVEKCF